MDHPSLFFEFGATGPSQPPTSSANISVPESGLTEHARGAGTKINAFDIFGFDAIIFPSVSAEILLKFAVGDECLYPPPPPHQVTLAMPPPVFPFCFISVT